MKKIASLLLCMGLCMGLSTCFAAGSAYEEAVAGLREVGYGTYGEEQTYEGDLCTLFSYSVTARHGPFAHLDLVYKAGSPLGEGTVISLPVPDQNAWGASSAPDELDWDPEGGTLTYSYYFDHPIYAQDFLSIRRAAGTLLYRVDLATGEVTESCAPLENAGAYDQAVEELRNSLYYNRSSEWTLETDDCTIFIYDQGGVMRAPHNRIAIIYKPGSRLGEGIRMDGVYPYPMFVYQGPDRLDLSEDRKTLTYAFLLESDEEAASLKAGIYTYTVDLPSGTTTPSYSPLTCEAVADVLAHGADHTLEKRLDGPLGSAILRWSRCVSPDEEGNDLRDYELYWVPKEGNSIFQQLLLPSTAKTDTAYAPTDRAPDALALCADGKTLTYNYFFDAPLSDGDTVYHEAGTYTYIVDTATGELEVTHTDEVPSPPQPAVSVFSDVPAGSWFETGVSTCAGKGVMIGTGGDSFSPERTLSQAECLTLAFRLYDLMQGNEHVIEKAPEDWGKLTLTLADGTVFEGYGYQGQGETQIFSWWSWRNGNEGACAQVPGWTYGDWEAGVKAQREWMDAHEDICGADAPATLTLNGVTYQGTANCWMPVGPYVLMFQPEAEKPGEVNSILHHAVFREVGPDRWWRDTAYTITQRGLEDIFDPVEFSDTPASRSFFSQLIADACQGHLEKINTIGDIPDLPREFPGPVSYPKAELYRDAVYALYEAGILTGVDQAGTFAADNTLTRAEAAVMVARALDPAQRISRDRSYHGIVGSLETEAGYEQETYFYSDASFRLPDNVTLILRYKPCAGDQSKRDYELWLVRREGDPQALRLALPSTEVLSDGSAPTTRVPDSIQTVPDPSDPERNVTLTYTYRFPEPLWNGNTMLHDKGTYTYTVDIPTGEQSAVLEDAYEKALADAKATEYPWQVDQQLEAPLCTILVKHSDGRDGLYPGASILLIFREGSPNGAGEVVSLPLLSGTSRYGSFLPDTIELDPSGTTLTYAYHYETDQYALTLSATPYLAYKAGTYTYTVDLASGTVTDEYTPN